MKYKIIYIPALAGLIFSLAACSSSEKKENADSQNSAFSKVLVAQVQNQNVQSTVTISGNADANQMVKIYAMSNGYVQSWRHDIGESVKRDEVLATLANPELMQEQAKAQAVLDGDKSIYDRLESIYKKTPELTPLEQVDEAKAKYESALAQLNAINSQISYLTIRAPFNGVITQRFVDTGSVVQDGLSRADAKPLFMIEDMSIIRLSVEVPEINSASITKGTLVKVTIPDLPNTSYDAKVSRVSYGLSEDTKTMLVQVDISNKDAKIHPGMFANVVFNISSQPNVMCVPNQAVTVYEEEPFVYKVVPVDSTAHNNWADGVKCRVEKLKVQLGVSGQSTTQVRYANFNPGDRIVVSGTNFCTNGAIVIAKEASQSNNVASH